MRVDVTSRPKAHGLIAGAALAWNLLGLAMFAMQMSMSPGQVAALPAPDRSVVEATPGWLTAAFGVATGAGVLGSIGLLLRQRWAVPSLAVSLVALFVQIGGAYLVTPAWAASGAAGLVLPVLLVAVGALLVRYARRATA
jgi:hypothetical protein